jgi:hypothetical protein
MEIVMPWRVEYLPAEDVVAVIAAGEVSNEDVGAQVAETMRVLKQNQASLVLVDYANALSEVSLASLYGLPDCFTRSEAPWNVRLAVVIPRTRYRIETYQFFELVCKNAGYNINLFEEREAAEDWLRQARPVRTQAGSTPEAEASCLAKTSCA